MMEEIQDKYEKDKGPSQENEVEQQSQVQEKTEVTKERSLQVDVKIYQIYYKEEQRYNMDINFIPYSNIRNVNPNWREYWVFREAYRKGLHKKANFTGFVSWKFNEKTRVDGKRVIDFIKNNNEYDVFFINPLPWEVDCFDNVWLQGEYYHKGILDFMQNILNKCDININLREIIHKENLGTYCNYWIGNNFFWDEYMKFTLPIYKYLTKRLSDKEKDFLYSDSNYYIGSNYIPFIMERMFSTLLSYNKKIKATNYRYTPEEKYRLTLNMYRIVRDSYYNLEEISDKYKELEKDFDQLKITNEQLQVEKQQLQNEYEQAKQQCEQLQVEKQQQQNEFEQLKAFWDQYQLSITFRIREKLNNYPIIIKIASSVLLVLKNLYSFFAKRSS